MSIHRPVAASALWMARRSDGIFNMRHAFGMLTAQGLSAYDAMIRRTRLELR